MSNAIHFINRREGSSLVGLERWSDEKHGFRSCCWKLSDEDASSLLGGWVYLHGAKGEKSSFGGRILGFEPGVGDMADRKVILFRADENARGQAWRGSDHAMAYTSGVVVGDLAHETEI